MLLVHVGVLNQIRRAKELRADTSSEVKDLVEQVHRIEASNETITNLLDSQIKRVDKELQATIAKLQQHIKRYVAEAR